MAGWLAGRLAGCWLLTAELAAWLAASLAGWLARSGWLAGWLSKKSDPLQNYCTQMEISFLLSHDAHIAHFHFNGVLLKRNMFKEVNVPKSRGALGTGFTYAPVLLFELYLAINNSSTSHSPLGILLLYQLLSIGSTPALRVITLHDS